MAISEKQRHDLFTKIEETFGPEHAATMMELLPPVGWADVATKRDLDVLRREIEALRLATTSEIEGLRLGTKADLLEFGHQLRRDVLTWLFSAMGVQTAVIGLLLVVTR